MSFWNCADIGVGVCVLESLACGREKEGGSVQSEWRTPRSQNVRQELKHRAHGQHRTNVKELA